MFGQTADNTIRTKNIQSKGIAGKDTYSPLELWNFERRAIGETDVLVEIKYSSICHSDIHTIRGHWGKQPFPLVPGHEIAGIVKAIGKGVSKFKVGDRVGVGVIADSCMKCKPCSEAQEQHCIEGMVGTYGAPYPTEPTGITQGGYASNIVTKEHFVFKIPDSMDLKYAAPLLCAGITVYSPLMRNQVKKGDKVGIVGIGGLGHLAVKLAVSKGAEVYAFTTSPSKVEDIKRFGAKEVIVVDKLDTLKAFFGKLDYMVSTVPYDFAVSDYISCVKPYGFFTQVGVGENGGITLNNFNMVNNSVNYNGSLVGGTAETQELLNYCAAHKIYPEVQVISASEVNEAWDKVVNKEARYRYVIDASTIV
ncbi:NAD(P)-dependent alcohol dehydrogenase [Sphingobacterium sp. WOUb80]|uniref:NAD(P)-dependent alcohol dehydrogenase n=1 Tax=Sphingobacterium sp. WOUb80 TaxID=3234028 RepID=UPI003CF591AC